ncbi:MAG: hypothetical protein AAGC55_08585, partial [Myxococcota bacterium]
QIDDGTVILLANVESDDLSESDCAGLSIYLGSNPSPSPCADETDETCRRHLDGSGQFDVQPVAAGDAAIAGVLSSGRFATTSDSQPGSFAIALGFGEDTTLSFNLVAARAEITVSETGLMSGVLGGAITEDDLQNSILPTAHQLLVDVIEVDCTGVPPDACCTPDSAGAALISSLDLDDDCAVSLTELRENGFLRTLLTPDVDLFDGDGAFAPGADNLDESISVGLGFTATGASFTAP